MSTSDNKAVARRLYEEIFNARQWERLGALFCEDYIEHAQIPGQPAGLAGLQFRLSALLRAFPDVQWRIEQVVREGDRVAVHWQLAGTHQGEFRGVAPTGRSVTMAGIDIYRFDAGRIAEHWHAVDVLGLLHQLGAALGPDRAPGAG
jgi:hypothetical protein